MRKNLLLLATCLSTLALNAMEWQTVFKEDFGGNSLDAPALGQTAPEGLNSDCYFITNPMDCYFKRFDNIAYLLKAAEKVVLTKNGISNTLAEISLYSNHSLSKGSDHTISGNTDKGYYMFVRKNGSGSKLIYRKEVTIPSGSQKFKASAWFSCAIQSPTGVLGGLNLEVRKPTGELIGDKFQAFKSQKANLTWQEMTLEFDKPDKNCNKVIVIIKNDDASCSEFAIDDIKVSAWTPSLDITSTVWKKGASLEAIYDYDKIRKFFGNSRVIYEWKKRSLNSDSWQTIGGGEFYSGSNLNLYWGGYYPSTHNGFYKLIISANGMNIEQEVEMNYTQELLNALGKEQEIVNELRSMDVIEGEDSEVTDNVVVYSDQNQLYVLKDSEQYTVYDMSGRVVAQSSQLPVNISVLKPGVYVVDVDGTRVKFVKK